MFKRALLLALLAVPAFAQPVAFDVASVKPAGERERGSGPVICVVPCRGDRITIAGSRVDIRFMSLDQLIVKAYGIKPYQLSGPAWMSSQRFDIAAKIPDGVSADRLPEMLQTLLAERFKLAIHRDSKELPVFALVAGKNGTKLTPPPPEADAAVPNRPGSQEMQSPHGAGRTFDDGSFMITGGPYGPVRGGLSKGMRMEFLKVTMPQLVEVLMPHMDRPVVDMTNVKGGYYILAEVHQPSGDGGGGRKGGGPPESGADSGTRLDAYGEALVSAIEKGGLKLESRKAPVEMIVVDHLEKTPTAN